MVTSQIELKSTVFKLQKWFNYRNGVELNFQTNGKGPDRARKGPGKGPEIQDGQHGLGSFSFEWVTNQITTSPAKQFLSDF